MKKKFSALIEKAFQVAKKAQKNAHAPYSNFHVGAALILSDQKTIVAGCNVENASYGGTVCAERNAVANAITTTGEKSYHALVVVTPLDPPAGPCGLCLQILSEFCKSDFPIYLANSTGIHEQVKFKDLLPIRFDEKSLKKIRT